MENESIIVIKMEKKEIHFRKWKKKTRQMDDNISKDTNFFLFLLKINSKLNGKKETKNSRKLNS